MKKPKIPERKILKEMDIDDLEKLATLCNNFKIHEIEKSDRMYTRLINIPNEHDLYSVLNYKKNL